jgi:hypothetical protein
VNWKPCSQLIRRNGKAFDDAALGGDTKITFSDLHGNFMLLRKNLAEPAHAAGDG